MSLTSVFSDPLFEILADQAKDRQVWLVGGAIRDHLQGRQPLDLDFAVENDARGLARRFADASGGLYYELDAERDTGRVILLHPDGSRRTIDFARLRGADITADLLARDFSINALAVALGEPTTLIDPAGGLQDLRDKIVKPCSADALSDDPVRTLRAIRIATDFEFRLDRDTSRQIEATRDGLRKVSAERIRDEFMRILDIARPAAALRVMAHLGLLRIVLPELDDLRNLEQPPPHAFDAMDHTLAVFERMGNLLGVLADEHDPDASGDIVLAQASLRLGRFREKFRTLMSSEISVGRSRRQLLHFAALYHDAGKPETRSVGSSGRATFHGHEQRGAEMVRERGRILRLSSSEVDHLVKIVRHHMRVEWLETQEKITRRAVYRFFRDAGDAGLDAVLISLADCLGKYAGAPPEDAWKRRVETARLLLEAWFEERAQRIDPDPLLSGSDLISALGMQPGPEVGRLLELVREAQAAGEVDSREGAIAMARKAMADNSP